MITKIKIEGMHCGSCKTLIEEVCKEIPGVTSCVVNLEQGTGMIEHSAPLDIAALNKEVQTVGKYVITEMV